MFTNKPKARKCRVIRSVVLSAFPQKLINELDSFCFKKFYKMEFGLIHPLLEVASVPKLIQQIKKNITLASKG